MSTHFAIYSVGLVCASVCTNLPNDQAADRLNSEHPTGITSRWEIAPDSFANGTPNGNPCPDTAGARHILFNC